MDEEKVAATTGREGANDRSHLRKILGITRKKKVWIGVVRENERPQNHQGTGEVAQRIKIERGKELQSLQLEMPRKCAKKVREVPALSIEKVIKRFICQTLRGQKEVAKILIPH